MRNISEEELDQCYYRSHNLLDLLESFGDEECQIPLKWAADFLGVSEESLEGELNNGHIENLTRDQFAACASSFSSPDASILNMCLWTRYLGMPAPIWGSYPKHFRDICELDNRACLPEHYTKNSKENMQRTEGGV